MDKGFRGKGESTETAEQVKKLTREDACNKQEIAALRGMVKNAQKAETLVGEKGLGKEGQVVGHGRRC